MLKAIIFDFNGVILNDEPLHFQSMYDTVDSIGIRITRDEYWRLYLPLDDATCLDRICESRSYHLDKRERERLLGLKYARYRKLLEDQYPLFPGAADFIRESAARYPVAIASGARRNEIEDTLRATGLLQFFMEIAAAEDFKIGKPHPESYLFALEKLNRAFDGRNGQVRPSECLVIEDTVDGVKGARAAGMSCLAVANTYPRENLTAANRVVSSLLEVKVEELEGLWQESA